MLKQSMFGLMIFLTIISCAKKEENADVSVQIAKTPVAAAQRVSREKKAIGPEDYAVWERLADPRISSNGEWIYYISNPVRGDTRLTLHSVESGKQLHFERAKRVSFSPDNNYLVFLRSPRFETTRQAKLKKVKADKMPKDSLCVYLFNADTLLTVPRVKSYSVNTEGNPWITLHLEKPLPPSADSSALKDTAQVPDSMLVAEEEPDSSKQRSEVKKTGTAKAKKTKVREEGTPLWVWHPLEADTLILEYAGFYAVSEKGDRIVATTKLKGKPDSLRITLIEPEKARLKVILEQAGEAKSFRFDKAGGQLAFLFSDDTAKQKIYEVYYWKKGRSAASCYLTEKARGIREDWTISSVRFPSFSKDGKHLYFGTAPRVEEVEEDTLLSNEKAKLDVWSWHDPLLQTQQNKELARERNRNYVARVDVGSKNVIQLADEEVPTLKISSDYDDAWVVGESNLPYRQLISWESLDYYDFYLVNTRSGEKIKILERKSYAPNLSPQYKYMVWYDHADSNWYVYDVAKQKQRNLSAGMEVPFYREDEDRPTPAGPYGFAAWGLGDRYVFLYDRYDIWKFDLEGEKPPMNVTRGAGRASKTVFRYLQLDSDLDYAPIRPILLSAFNEKTKASGYASGDLYEGAEPEMLAYSDHQYTRLSKAKNADVLIWRKGDFRNYPDLWVSDLNFEHKSRISALNPQQSQYRWASVELVEWKNSDGVELQGMLYIPDDLDTSKKHPMIVYYYEKYSEYLHSYTVPTPSYSTVNRIVYPSNGYILFIPDIVYKVGYPGKSGLDCVMSGVDMLLEKYPFIDEARMGIQGQSWGGYQTAYFITQTDRFAAAMAGAPVSNMTSAYGGIRWGSGLVRMMQYEGGQSRIGGTLWEDFDRYVENSPLFFADRIQTPLLMMHNDEDGAVPWTQGIEMMTAMRRLQKPGWMLVYNGDDHNLKENNWGNRMDLTIRMMQFFDHYLKDAPMPRWMKEGISATEKGRDYKLDLIPEE
ncbi:MAG: prolyl oligopeptidase family serine peptidase [Candidatus Marinimicrobia bacterium]|nr:prolyl oligopeptidase family serine peptidase [Candidatus Neomarinimicrobiota bacterium]